MNTTEIKELQKRVGATPDGFWGRQSIAACQKHLRAMMPKPNPWPKTDQVSLTRAFGKPGDETLHAVINVKGLGVKYDGAAVSTIRCHTAVSQSLQFILETIAKSASAFVLGHYAGCYNNRAMRGGSLPSLHARAAAIDFWPEKNGNKTSWPVGATMPLEVMEIFAREGWLSAGAFWGRDAMHFQATQ